MKTARGKKQVCYASSLCFLASGALVMGAISWEAYNIIVLHQFEPGMSAPICKCKKLKLTLYDLI